jgi:hypothetical protein
MGVSGQRHASAALWPAERTHGTHCTRGWVGLRAGLDTDVRGKSFVPAGNRTPITRSSSPQSDTILTVLPRLLLVLRPILLFMLPYSLRSPKGSTTFGFQTENFVHLLSLTHDTCPVNLIPIILSLQQYHMYRTHYEGSRYSVYCGFHFLLGPNILLSSMILSTPLIDKEK